MKQKILCPKCEGDKCVFDPFALLLTIGLPFALLMEHGEKEGMTKKKCPRCNEKGYLEF